MRKVLAFTALPLLALATGCSMTNLPRSAAPALPAPTARPNHSTWDVYDAGGVDQYPAWFVHYSADWQEDEAADVCEQDRGGYLLPPDVMAREFPGERFVCIVD